jgi:hypothetical protein
MRLGAQTAFFRLGGCRLAGSSTRWKRVGGTVVAHELDDLGAAVVSSYLGSRQVLVVRAHPGSGFDLVFGRGWGSLGLFTPVTALF